MFFVVLLVAFETPNLETLQVSAITIALNTPRIISVLAPIVMVILLHFPGSILEDILRPKPVGVQMIDYPSKMT